MTWAAGQSLITGPLVADLAEFYVFGATDSGKNLVSGTTHTPTLAGTAAYGSDAIGTYVTVSGFGDYWQISNGSEAAFGTDTAVLLVFARTGSNDGFTDYFRQNVTGGSGAGIGLSGTYNFQVSAVSAAYDMAVDDDATVMGTSVEFAVLINYATGKFYYTGGSAASTFPAAASSTGTPNTLRIGNGDNTNYVAENTRFYAYGRWTDGSSLDDADCQSIADNPQQLIGVGGGGGGASTDEGRGTARGMGRGLARGMHRRITDWLRLPSGVLIPA